MIIIIIRVASIHFPGFKMLAMVSRRRREKEEDNNIDINNIITFILIIL